MRSFVCFTFFQLVLTRMCVCYFRSILHEILLTAIECGVFSVFEMHYFPGLKIARLFFLIFFDLFVPSFWTSRSLTQTHTHIQKLNFFCFAQPDFLNLFLFSYFSFEDCFILFLFKLPIFFFCFCFRCFLHTQFCTHRSIIKSCVIFACLCMCFFFCSHQLGAGERLVSLGSPLCVLVCN